MKLSLICVLLCLVLLFFSAAVAQEGEKEEEKTIVAKGVAATGKDPAAARDEAILDGLRKAVEQGIGTFITSRTEVKDFAVISDKILSESRGYIKEYKIIKEGKEEGENGELTWVEIEAVVKLSKLRGDWDELKFYLKQKGDPKVLVVLTEKIDGQEEGKGDFGTREVENFFKEKGTVNVVDRTTLEEAKLREIAKASASGDLQKVAHLGGAAGANIVIIGTIEASFKEEREPYKGVGKHNWYKSQAGAKAVRTDDAKILCSKNAEGKDGVDQAKRGAAIKAIQNAGLSLAPVILEGILKEWAQDISVGSQITLVIKDVNFAQWLKIKKVLSAIRGVSDVNLDNISNNIATIRLKSILKTEKFAERLMKLEDVDLSNITDVSENTIHITFKEKKEPEK
jgi:hypothetical protein